MKVVIVAGGRGKRISEIFPGVPKPLIPIDGIPILERQLTNFKEQGFKEFIFTVSYLSEQIIRYFGDGRRFGVNIEYYIENEPLGNAGALFHIKEKLSKTFILVNADSLFNFDFSKMLLFHFDKKSLITIAVHPNSHPFDSAIIEIDNDHRVVNWFSKEDKKPEYYSNLVNAGIHVVEKSILEEMNFPDKVDLDRDILKKFVNAGLYAYKTSEYIKDMGTPERYKSVSEDVKNGLYKQNSGFNYRPAIFLDRDGTVNVYKGFINKLSQIELIDGVCEAIKKINNSQFLAIVITNQPVIARGEATFDDVNLMHKKIETLLGNNGAYLDGIYFCPHHPDSGFEGEVKELKINCNCRKPKPGLIFKAAEDFKIDLSSSWMIGDSDIDILTGINAGCHTKLVDTNYTLLDAVNDILGD